MDSESSEDRVAETRLPQTIKKLRDLEGLMNQLLTVSHLEGAAEWEELDLATVAEDVLELIEPLFPEGLALRTEISEDCVIVGSRVQLRPLIVNLVTNAGQAMDGLWEERPTVLEVGVQRVQVGRDLAERYVRLEPGAYAHLSVSDTGTGISPEEEGRMFDSGAGRDREETESGLSLVRHIVDAHQGLITVRTHEGRGTTFNVYLPLAEDDDHTSRGPENAVLETERHVLVVDDSELILDLEGGRISRLGYEVTTKVSGRQALEAIRENPDTYDLVLIDYQMPGLDGMEFAHALRKEGLDIPVVMMTAYGAKISDAKARVVGINQFVKKPIEQGQLEEILTRLED